MTDTKKLTLNRIPGLEGVVLTRSSGPIPTSARHMHDSLSLGVVLSGVRAITMHGETFHAEVGEVVVIPPEQPHSCPDLGDCSYLMISVPTSLIQALGFPTSGPTDYAPVEDNPLLFGKIIKLSGFTDHPSSPMEHASALIDILSLVLTADGNNTSQREPIPDDIEQTKYFLERHCCDPIRLEVLAAQAGLSPCRLNRQFSKNYGMPPHEYQNQLRIRQAKQCIASGVSLADTAAQCGFTDQSHMNRCFKRVMGMTPGAYAASFR